MAFKAMLLLLATFLVVTTRVSSNSVEPPPQGYHGKVPVPVKEPASAPIPPVTSEKECVPLCEERCKSHRKKRPCMKACTACCDRCKCVPPGTFGNEEKCGKCYTEVTKHGQKYECP